MVLRVVSLVCFTVLGTVRRNGVKRMNVAPDEWQGFAERVQRVEPSLRRLIGSRWSRQALGEHASVGSFAQFTLQLLAVGAPPQLLIGAQRAGLDEVEHARVSFRIASVFMGVQVGPGLLPLPRSMPGASLLDSARATLLEGCIAETLSAAEVEQAARAASEPVIKRVLEQIVDDELRHAALAFEFVGWAVSTGGESVRSALRENARERLAQVRALSEPEAANEDLRPWGILSDAERGQIGRKAADDIVRPALEGVLGALEARADSTSAAEVSEIS